MTIRGKFARSLVLLVVAIGPWSLGGRQARAATPVTAALKTPPQSRSQDASLDDYRKHLRTLAGLVDACAKTRDLKNCDPMLVGPDDRIPLGSGTNPERRLVRFGWLRVLLSKAEEPDALPAKIKQAANKDADTPTTPPMPTTSELLKSAEARLASDRSAGRCIIAGGDCCA